MKQLKRGLCALGLVLLAAGALTGGYLVDRQNKAALGGGKPDHALYLEEGGVRYGERVFPLPEWLGFAAERLYAMMPARARILGQAVRLLGGK